MAKIVVEDQLIEQVKTANPELKRLDTTDVVDVALRKMLEVKA